MKKIKVKNVVWLCFAIVFFLWYLVNTKEVNIIARFPFENFSKIELISKSTQVRSPATKKAILKNSQDYDTKIIHLIKRPKLEFLKVPKFNISSCWISQCMESKNVRWQAYTFVKSSIDNLSLRQAIRRTWASVRYIEEIQFFTIFMIGNESAQSNKLDFEFKKYGDILQVNVRDDYRNLVYKTIAGMQWASDNLSKEAFYSLVDDDMFVHITWVHHYITDVRHLVFQKQWPTFPILCMYELHTKRSPIREEENKYYCSTDDYKWPFWPDFCLGGMYTTTVDVISQLWKISRTENIISLEDVWVTGILSQQIGMPKEMLIPINPPVAMHINKKDKNLQQREKASFMLSMWRKVLSGGLIHKDVCVC